MFHGNWANLSSVTRGRIQGQDVTFDSPIEALKLA
jgi:hypothetical protein